MSEKITAMIEEIKGLTVLELSELRSKLNELEDYWQDFYKAKEFGYSIK